MDASTRSTEKKNRSIKKNKMKHRNDYGREGKDYGIRVDVPWYLKLPIIRRLFNTCLLDITLFTFTAAGSPLIGMSGSFRVPFEKHDLDIGSLLRLRFAFPRSKGLGLIGYGLYARLKLVDVNFRKVEDARRGTSGSPLIIGFEVHNKERSTYFPNEWHDEVIDLKIAKGDFQPN